MPELSHLRGVAHGAAKVFGVAHAELLQALGELHVVEAFGDDHARGAAPGRARQATQQLARREIIAHDVRARRRARATD